MNLNDMFDAVIVLNLDRRTDRLESITYQLDKLNTKFHRWPAIDHTYTDMSPIFCNALNNKGRWFYAQWKGYKQVLFLDDDCIFVDNFYEKLEKVWAQIPDDWDVVSFCETFGSTTPVNDNIKRVHESWGGHAMAIKISALPIISEAVTGNTFLDIELNKINDKLNKYVIDPGLVTQLENHSDLINSIRPNNMYNVWH